MAQSGRFFQMDGTKVGKQTEALDGARLALPNNPRVGRVALEPLTAPGAAA
jgi:hypothetical protein